MKTRNKRNKRKTRKIKGGAIDFNRTSNKWESKRGISGVTLEYSNGEAGFLNKLGVGYVPDTLEWFRDIETIRGLFQQLNRGNILHATTQEEMRQGGYAKMQYALFSLKTAVEKRNDFVKTFETLTRIHARDRDGNIVERDITEHDKERHRERAEVLRHLLTVLEDDIKEYSTKYYSMDKKPKQKQKKPEFASYERFEVEDGPDDPDDGPVESSLPQKNVKKLALSEAERFRLWEEEHEQELLERERFEEVERERLERDRVERETLAKRCPGPGCTKEGIKFCSACKKVKYCSPECSRLCWKEHKPVCIKPDVVPELPPLHYVTTLPFYVEDIRSLVMLDNKSFVCIAVTKTQILVFTVNQNVYIGPFIFMKKPGRDVALKNTELDSKVGELSQRFDKEKDPRYLEEMVALVSDANREEERQPFTEKREALVRAEGPKVKAQFVTILDAVSEFEKKNKKIDELLEYLVTQKNPFIVSELSRLNTKYGSLQKTDALIEDIKSMLKHLQEQTPAKAEAIGKLIVRIDNYFDIKRKIKLLQDYENLNEIGIPVQSPSGLVMVGNGLVVSMGNFIYDISRGIKIGGIDGFNPGTNVTCRMRHPTDMLTDGNSIICTDSGNHCLFFYDIHTNDALSIPTVNTPGYVNGRDISKWRLNTPMGITADEEGNIILADTENDCIRKMTIGSGENRGKNNLITIAGGEPGASYSHFKKPRSVCMFGRDIIVADTGNHCIRKLTRTPDGYKMDVIAGTVGQEGLKDGRDSLFSYPSKVVVYNGNIYVADRGNSRIRMIVDHDPMPNEFPKGLVI